MVEVIEMNKWYFICSLLIVVIVAESVAFLNLNSIYISLSSNYDSLKMENQALTEAHDSLSQNYSSLETNYTNIELQYDILQMDFAILQLNYCSLEANYTSAKTENSEVKAQYNNLSIQFTKLAENYTTLKNQYTQLTEHCTILETQFIDLAANYSSLQAMYRSLQTNYANLETRYDSLQMSYSDLQEEYNRYIAAYQELRDKINQRLWLEAIVELFITPEDSDVGAIVYNITGGWSDPSDFNEYWDDLKAMYMWMRYNIDYRYDGLYPKLPVDPSGSLNYYTDMWQFPNETLSLMKGDCEDQAILLCSMIRCYCTMEYFAECIWITSSSSAHVAVQIPVSEYELVIFDPAGNYYSHDLLDNIVFNDITTEINNWLDYWKPSMGDDVYVHRVFSDYLDETFASTADYLSWKYSR